MKKDFTDLSSEKGAQASYSVAKARISFKLNSSLSLMRERTTRQIKVVFNWFGLNTFLIGLFFNSFEHGNRRFRLTPLTLELVEKLGQSNQGNEKDMSGIAAS